MKTPKIIFPLLLLAAILSNCSKNNPTSCSDGIKNGVETGIDCGGNCPACPSCSDGIQNQGETGIDCGGPCTPCPVCVPPATYSLTVTNEPSTWQQYKDSIVNDTIKIYFLKYFSPNGDALNDICYFTVEPQGSATSFDYKVSDFCSHLMFQSTDPNLGWDGKYYNQIVAKGIYKRSLSCTLVNGQSITKVDSLQVILY